eukprot:IDg15787t1
MHCWRAQWDAWTAAARVGGRGRRKRRKATRGAARIARDSKVASRGSTCRAARITKYSSNSVARGHIQSGERRLAGAARGDGWRVHARRKAGIIGVRREEERRRRLTGGSTRRRAARACAPQGRGRQRAVSQEDARRRLAGAAADGARMRALSDVHRGRRKAGRRCAQKLVCGSGGRELATARNARKGASRTATLRNGAATRLERASALDCLLRRARARRSGVGRDGHEAEQDLQAPVLKIVIGRAHQPCEAQRALACALIKGAQEREGAQCGAPLGARYCATQDDCVTVEQRIAAHSRQFGPIVAREQRGILPRLAALLAMLLLSVSRVRLILVRV